jgi:hypothetical protein
MVNLQALDSFATSPENAFSIIVATLLANVLGSGNIELNFPLLGICFFLFVTYILLLILYCGFKGPGLSSANQLQFNRHVFHAGLWVEISGPIVWSSFLYPHLTYDQVLASYGRAILQLRSLLPAFYFFLPLILLLFCQRVTNLRIQIVPEFKRLVGEHWLEIIISLVATMPFITAYLGTSLKRVDPLVWLSILFSVLIWSRIASSRWPRRDLTSSV